MFWGYTGISLSVRVYVYPSICLSVYKILVSVKSAGGGVQSHSVTVLVVNLIFLKTNNAWSNMIITDLHNISMFFLKKTWKYCEDLVLSKSIDTLLYNYYFKQPYL